MRSNAPEVVEQEIAEAKQRLIDYVKKTVKEAAGKEVRLTGPAPLMPLIANKIQGRNEPCPCGSGKKFKKCCLKEKP